MWNILVTWCIIKQWETVMNFLFSVCVWVGCVVCCCHGGYSEQTYLKSEIRKIQYMAQICIAPFNPDKWFIFWTARTTKLFSLAQKQNLSCQTQTYFEESKCNIFGCIVSQLIWGDGRKCAEPGQSVIYKIFLEAHASLVVTLSVTPSVFCLLSVTLFKILHFFQFFQVLSNSLKSIFLE